MSELRYIPRQVKRLGERCRNSENEGVGSPLYTLPISVEITLVADTGTTSVAMPVGCGVATFNMIN